MAAGATASGIVLPRIDAANQPMKYFQSFVGLEEYFGSWLEDETGAFDNERWIQLLISQHPRDLILIELAFLNFSLRRSKLYNDLQEQFAKTLPAELADRFRREMAKPDVERVFLARQPILMAMREMLLYEGPTNQTIPLPPHTIAVMLAHAFASRLGHLDESGPELWPTVSASIAMELVQNYLFNQRDDIFPRLDRYTRLWDDYGAKLQRTKLRATPSALLLEATGVERADLFAVAFSLFSRILSWQPGQSFLYDPYSGIGMSRATFDSALQVFTCDENMLRAELRDMPTDWAMLPFERHPVLRLGDGVLVLDQDYLLERVTSGLYWLVHDHEEVVGGRTAANLWSQAYSEMIEALAEDSLRAMAPLLFGSNAGKTFYTEDDVEAAYGEGTRRCDAAIYFGQTLALFEVQKGQVSLDTRQQGKVEKFMSDTDRMVLEKAAQLDGTAQAVFGNESALTGFPPTNKLRILPVAIQGATYPVNPITTEYISIKLKERGLFTDPRLYPFAVIDIGELEMLEGLVDNRGISVADALLGWKRGPGWRFALRNHLLEAYGGGDYLQFRPKRMGDTVDKVLEKLAPRLKLQAEPAPA
jgi:hypothetical protein